MSKLFIEGGILFMSVLTIEFLVLLSMGIVYGIGIKLKGSYDSAKLDFIKSMGTLALVTGVLGQFIGLYSAFQAISKAGNITQSLLVQGLKVSSITTIYGLVIMIISFLIWFGLQTLKSKTRMG